MKTIFRYFFAFALSLTLGLQAQEINFKQNKSSAAKASLTSNGFYTDFVLDVANFSPELRMPIQVSYDSSSKAQGLLGFAWNIPQLESTVTPDKNGAIWTTPWGEKVAFYSRKNTDKETLAMFNETERENAYFSPFADWTANGREDSGSWTIFGRKELKGWKFTYLNGRLLEIVSHTGESLQFVYDGTTLKEVKQKSEAFISLKYKEKTLSEISINGIAHKIEFVDGKAQILPETLAGKEENVDVKFLSSVAKAPLNPITFNYDNAGFLTQIKRGEYEENLVVEQENVAYRKDYLRKIADAKKAGKSLSNIKRQKIAGRILSDNNFKYTYPSGKIGDIKLENKLKQVASYNYDSGTGVFKHTDFAGKASEIYYFMRYDVAYNGKIRQMVDAQKRVIGNYRYDKDSGKITRFRDLAKNDVNLKYDSKGKLIEIAKRGADETNSTPIKSFEYERDSLKPKAINILNERGEIAQTTVMKYNREQRLTSVDDGRNAIKLNYNNYGYPLAIADSIGNETKIFYDRYNRVIARENPNGTKTFTEYNAFGQVAKTFTKLGDEILSSVELAYDANGAPLSYKDQNGLEKKYERDAFGRVEKEIFADKTQVFL